MDKIKKHGGARPGAGAPKKNETKPIFIRVPKVDHAELDKRCRVLVSSFYNNA